MFDYRRTHDCNALRLTEAGNQVTVSGWVHRRRDHGGIIFIDLRDKRGLVQLVFDPDLAPKAHDIAQALRSEWVISAKGKVRPRSEGMANPNLDTGEIEIEVHEFSILSKAKTPPFSVCDEHVDVHEELRLKYRYLDIRRGDILEKLQKRHRCMLEARNYLNENHFSEVTTPILGKSTPEGARDYLVPSRVHPAKFYALPQSPQIFKQLLMISGMERYFQFATCFRDEDLRSDRQPEFMQIDIEMSFVTQEEVLSLTEGLMQRLFKEVKNIAIPSSFKRMSHKDCLEFYGTDRPDLRFDLKLNRLDDIAKDCGFSVFSEQVASGGVVKGICFKKGAKKSRREIDKYIEFVKPFGLQGLAWMKLTEGNFQSSIVKFFTEAELQEIQKRMNASDDDLLLFAAGEEAIVNQGLDHLRRHIAKSEDLIKKEDFQFLWVVDFPLFSFNENEQRMQSEHHPFTAPHPEDIEKVESNPYDVRSIAYDLVLNGYEIGGGSQRIHDQDLQQKIFQALNLSQEEIDSKFGFFIEALRFGTPPHAGIALGFDRIMMLLTDTENIRDVIAFPKTQKAFDLMMECPSSVQDKQLTELHIQTDAEIEKKLGY